MGGTVVHTIFEMIVKKLKEIYKAKFRFQV